MILQRNSIKRGVAFLLNDPHRAGRLIANHLFFAITYNNMGLRIAGDSNVGWHIDNTEIDYLNFSLRACLPGQKGCRWLEGYPFSRVNFERLYEEKLSLLAGWPSITSSQLLTNLVKAFPGSCLGQASQSIYMRKSCLTPGLTLSHKKGDPTPRVTPKPITRGKCEMCHINARRQGEVKWMQSGLVQGSFGGSRVTFLPGTTFIHVNTPLVFWNLISSLTFVEGKVWNHAILAKTTEKLNTA